MYRVGQMRQKTFIPVSSYLTAAEATKAVRDLNNNTPYVKPAPLPPMLAPMPYHPKVGAKPVMAKLR
jgi:hypothetical protein